jgi:DNA polymerase-1
MKLVFDIEANGLLPTVSKFHCAGAIDYNTGKEYWFRPEEFGKFLNFLMEADTVIAHNAFGYDIPALYKLAGIYGMKFEIDPAKVQCTKVMSQVLNYRRF